MKEKEEVETTGGDVGEMFWKATRRGIEVEFEDYEDEFKRETRRELRGHGGEVKRRDGKKQREAGTKHREDPNE